jgi:DNA polymerase/3'-5' exonuclease PolX
MAEVAAVDNSAIAKQLRNHARQLEIEGGNLLRVRAYRRAAQMIVELDEQMTEILDRSGRRGLQSLPSIGPGIARVIERLIRTGALPPRSRASAV